MALLGQKIVVVMPAYNAELTLERTLDEMPRDIVDHIILVDDNSTDGTVALAEKLGLEAIAHDQNRGYGGNQKTCYDAALKHDADIVAMVHPRLPIHAVDPAGDVWLDRRGSLRVRPRLAHYRQWGAERRNAQVQIRGQSLSDRVSEHVPRQQAV